MPNINPCPIHPSITGVILAGGRGTRMGGVDKGLVDVAGRPNVERISAILAAQVNRVIISANRNIDAYKKYACAVVSDQCGTGPLAGLLAALHATDTDYILGVPCDSPAPPNDLAARLYETLKREQVELCVAHDGLRLQPLFVLLSRTLTQDLSDYLHAGERRVTDWIARHRYAVADFSDQPHAFMNMNAPCDRALLEHYLGNAE